MDEEKQGGGTPPAGTPPEKPQAPDDPYGYSDDPYAYNPAVLETAEKTQAGMPVPQAPSSVAVVPAGVPIKPPPPAPPVAPDEDDEDDEGMLRMSFLEHLE